MTNKNHNPAFRALALIAFLFNAAFLNQTFAQGTEAQISKIRAAAAATNKRIEAGLKDGVSGLHYAAWTLGGAGDGQQWRAVGTMKTTDEFWFDGEPGFDEGQAADARKTIRRIVSTVASTDTLNSRAEYLFDQTGELVFVYSTEYTAGEDGSSVERRFYFQRGKLIRFVEGDKTRDGKFTAGETAAASEQQRAAKRLQNRFALMFTE